MRSIAIPWLAVAAVMALAGCAGGAALRPEATLPGAARLAPRGYIVVTVRNPLLPLPTRAASTARGYDSGGPYLAGSMARRTAEDIGAAYRLELTASWPIAALGVHCIVYALAPDTDPGALLARLARDRRVESAQPLLSFDTASLPYNDPYADLQPNLQRLGVPEAHSFGTGAGVRVAIIDTGADTTHPDLRPGTVRERNFVDSDERIFRSDAHGTAVAGVIAAVPNNHLGIVGIAPDVTLLTYKACWRVAPGDVHAVCNTFTLAQALAAAIDERADVINLSLSGPSDPLLTRLVLRALASGAIIVGAVPGAPGSGAFPAGISGVIGVDAIEDSPAPPATVRAPGREVLSLSPDGHYDFYSGSSMATAEVSGMLALLRAQRPRLSAPQAIALLERSTPAASAAQPAPVPNVCAALRSLLQRGDCALTP